MGSDTAFVQVVFVEQRGSYVHRKMRMSCRRYGCLRASVIGVFIISV